MTGVAKHSQEQPGGDALDMTSDAGRRAARETQTDLTRSVGRHLTRDAHDAHLPRWKRWLGKR
jgi:hypothetical protein